MSIQIGNTLIAGRVESTDPSKIIPDQTGNAGKFLSTNGKNVLWNDIDLSLYATKTDLTTKVNTSLDNISQEGKDVIKAQVDLTPYATKTELSAYQEPLVAIAETSGTVALEINKIYTMTINGATTFTLPTPTNLEVFNQIKIMAKVEGTPAITWGTDKFFGKTIPEITADSYDFYFDFDKLMNAWVVGVLIKGVNA